MISVAALWMQHYSVFSENSERHISGLLDEMNARISKTGDDIQAFESVFVDAIESMSTKDSLLGLIQLINLDLNLPATIDSASERRESDETSEAVPQQVSINGTSSQTKMPLSGSINPEREASPVAHLNVSLRDIDVASDSDNASFHVSEDKASAHEAAPSYHDSDSDSEQDYAISPEAEALASLRIELETLEKMVAQNKADIPNITAYQAHLLGLLNHRDKTERDSARRRYQQEFFNYKEADRSLYWNTIALYEKQQKPEAPLAAHIEVASSNSSKRSDVSALGSYDEAAFF
jgi:hypothetical protein